MAAKMERTKYQNVFQRCSETRRNPRDGKLDACYYIIYRNNGKKVLEKVGWKSEGYTAQHAFQIHGERIQAIRHGEPIKSKADAKNFPLTFGQAWDMYRDKWLPNLSRPKDEQSRYENHIAAHFANKPLADIKVLDLEVFKQSLLNKKLSPKTAKHVLCLIRSVFKKAVEWELYDGRIPTTTLQMPKVDNARVRYLTAKEAESVLAALKQRNLIWWQIASISLNAGLRLGEILSLVWSDIDLPAGVIHVRFGKNGTRMALMTENLKDMFAAMPVGLKSDLIFMSGNGKKIQSCTASEAFTAVAKKLNLNKNIVDRRQLAVFHTLRHTFASWMAIKGVPLYTIAELMGHSTIEMTKRYAHLCPDTKREAIRHIDIMSGRLA